MTRVRYIPLVVLSCRRSTMTRYMCLSHLFRSLLLAPNLSRWHDGSCGVFQHVIHNANWGGRQQEALDVANCVGIAANIEQAFQISTLESPRSDHLSYIMLTGCSYNTGLSLVILLTKAGIVLRFGLSRAKRSSKVPLFIGYPTRRSLFARKKLPRCPL